MSKTFKTFKQELSEAAGPSGAEYESIITVGYNQGKPPYSLKKAKDKAAFDSIAKFFPKYNQEAEALGQQFQKAGISGDMKQHGASKDSTTPLWKKYSEKGKDTPKTDMYAGKYNISLKKKGGSQLMSAAKKESIATLMAALEMAGENKQIDKLVNKIEKNFKTLIMDGTIGALEDDKKDKYGKFTDMSQADRDALIAKKVKIDTMHKSLGNTINKTLQEETAIKENVCYIATTGYKKFPKGSRGIANRLIEFDPKKGTLTHNINTGTPKAISADMKKMAAATSFYCAFKTGKKNPYSTLRTKTGKFESIQTLNGLMIETLKENLNVPTLLNENVLTESEIIEGLLSKGIEKIKKIGQSFKDWFSHIISKVVEGAKKVFQKIVSLGKRAFEALFDFLGLIITNAKIRVKGVAGGFAAK
jgi:hypothetical protein